MSTKVKGGAIKEGSIPLSALSNEVKDKIENAGGGADWNAKEGEAGYIENKPFEYRYSYKEDINTEFTSSDMTQDFFIFSEEDIHKNFTLRYTGELYYNDLGSSIVYKIGDTGGSILVNKLYESFSDSNFSVSCYYDDSELGYFISVTYNKGKDDPKYEVRNANIEIIVDEKIVKIDEKYLSDTVLKTTPQTLSDDAKNQALANLGIDPVVLKYLVNPFILGEYILTIPLELRDIILGDYSEEFGYTLKPIASSLIKIYNGAGFTSIATFGNGQDYNIDFENNKFIINDHYEIVFV